MTQPPADNTYIFDPESPTEMVRLTNQGRSLTKGMGGNLTGLSGADIAGLHNIVDLGCGPGDWVLDMAFAYPEITVAGIDISRTMVDYANTRTQSQGLYNASFGVMNITEPLDFPDVTFDMVNARFLFAALHREKWPPFLAECLRILRPGGILRLTEPIDAGISSSLSHTKLSMMLCKALWNMGYSFSVDGQSIGITYMLPRLLRQAGYQDIKRLGYAMEYSAETENWADGYRNSQITYLQALPLFVKYGLETKENAQQLYEQMLIDYHAQDFCVMWHYMTVLGHKPLS